MMVDADCEPASAAERWTLAAINGAMMAGFSNSAREGPTRGRSDFIMNRGDTATYWCGSVAEVH